MTAEELGELATEREIAGRSSMTKAELIMANRRYDLSQSGPDVELTRAPYTALTLDALRDFASKAEAAAQRAENALAQIQVIRAEILAAQQPD
jgi:hypothetical protein